VSVKEKPVIAERIRGHAGSIEARHWQAWLDEAAHIVSRFNDEEGDDPFGYNEAASVSLLSMAAARIGFLALAEYVSIKKSRKDRRMRANGRADFWMTNGDNRTWCFEFKQITSGRVTRARLEQKMSEAETCTRHLIRYGQEHQIAGLIVPLYTNDLERRAAAENALLEFAQENDFTWRLRTDTDYADTFLFFKTVTPSK
jgi:hypothetical protein